MRYENGKALDLRLAYIGGGSRGWAWNFMTDLASDPAPVAESFLHDPTPGPSAGTEPPWRPWPRI